MGWLPFSKSTNAPSDSLGPNQIEQRSHHSVGLGAGNQGFDKTQSDISTTLEQITQDHERPLDIQNVDLTSSSLEETVSGFVRDKPKNLYIIDGEKNIKQSIICTSDTNGGKTCLKLGVNSIELFKTMQKLEYFCSLPDDIDATYFECRKIE
ncbi:uncharacterized protein CANTADRAFT_7571 [Suhomyces tanzawaensis NRRL Y-17324]|uniref:Uncharacterized protein n=1 Tax=Suhomyces tanzawaensis NRRL Y-17324 TaxID=984487 RepID=A0A1E4SF73_9ASCO|nr:uncharacterized protein CANTADRAFT_7571 [Suhomyces tanzawaensis NRRL Y-17324]ODV78115.1 hypothetical protein CANTADRAFT_7571 [Suhomyces tanzawaensis NRRL Y-17324]